MKTKALASKETEEKLSTQTARMAKASKAKTIQADRDSAMSYLGRKCPMAKDLKVVKMA